MLTFKIILYYIFIYCLNSSWCSVTEKNSTYATKNSDLINSFGNTTVFFDIISHISNLGELMLQNIDDKVKKQLDITTNITVLQENCDEYFASIDAYSSFVSNQTVKCELEREFYILDFVESARIMLIKQCNELLQEIVSIQNENNRNILSYDTTSLSDYIEKAAINVKKDSLAYICQKVNLCRRFPAYSDYFAEILDEFFELPDTTFQAAIKLLSETIKLKTTFFKTIMDDDIAKLASSLFSYLEEDLLKTKVNFFMLKGVIKNKNKFFRYRDGNIKPKKKALRILIDIVDKAFEKLTEDSIQTEVNEVVNGLRAWTKSDSIDIQKIFMDYVSNVENILAPILLDNTMRLEVQTLIELMVKGSSEYSIENELLNEGSKFVKHGILNTPRMWY